MSWEEVKPVTDQGFHAYKFHEKLSNGQIVGVYFHLIEYDSFNVAVVIGENVQECEDWIRANGEGRQLSGRCGLEGLAVALKLILWFANNRLTKGDKLVANGVGKRARAYKFLTRYGFVERHNNKLLDREGVDYVFTKAQA